MSSLTAFSRIPFSIRMDAATERSSLEQPQQQVLGADVIVQEPIGLFSRKLKNPLRFRAERDSSTEVETFSRNTVRPSISLRIFSRERCERAKIRLVSPLPSRMRPRSRCSVSIDMLPS